MKQEKATFEEHGQGPIDIRLAGSTRLAIKTLAVIAVCIVLYYGRTFFLPIVMAIVIALTFSPIIKLGQRFLLPSAVSSGLLIFSFASAVGLGFVTLAEPFSELVSEAPSIGEKLNAKLSAIQTPMATFSEATKEVERIANGGANRSSNQMMVHPGGLIARAANDFAAIAASVILTLVLSFFLLVSRDMFYRKTLRVLPKLSDKKKALQVISAIEHDVSQYLLTVSSINIVIGVLVGGSFWLLGMPNPLLWGVMAGLLNFLPYVGALMGVLISASVAIITYPTLSEAAIVPLVYLLITFIEGQFLTPTILGRRFSLNTVIILVSLGFWGFIWGAAGVLIAVPLLIIMKVLCDHIEGFAGLAEFLSGDDTQDPVAVQAEAVLKS